MTTAVSQATKKVCQCYLNLSQQRCSGFALDSSSRRLKGSSPKHAASIKGVSPIMSLEFTSALATRSCFTSDSCGPALNKDNSGVSPMELVSLTSAPGAANGHGAMELFWNKQQETMPLFIQKMLEASGPSSEDYKRAPAPHLYKGEETTNQPNKITAPSEETKAQGS